MSISRVNLNGVCFLFTTLLVMIPFSLCRHHNNRNFFNDEDNVFKRLRSKGSSHDDKRGVFGELKLPGDEPDCSSIAFCDVCVPSVLGQEVKCVLCSGRREPSLDGDRCERQNSPFFRGRFNSTMEAPNFLKSFSKAPKKDN